MLFDEGVNGTEQIRDSLDLVDEDHLPVGLSAHQVEEALGTRPVALQGGRMEQVDAQAVPVAVLGPGRGGRIVYRGRR